MKFICITLISLIFINGCFKKKQNGNQQVNNSSKDDGITKNLGKQNDQQEIEVKKAEEVRNLEKKLIEMSGQIEELEQLFIQHYSKKPKNILKGTDISGEHDSAMSKCNKTIKKNKEEKTINFDFLNDYFNKKNSTMGHVSIETINNSYKKKIESSSDKNKIKAELNKNKIAIMFHFLQQSEINEQIKESAIEIFKFIETERCNKKTYKTSSDVIIFKTIKKELNIKQVGYKEVIKFIKTKNFIDTVVKSIHGEFNKQEINNKLIMQLKDKPEFKSISKIYTENRNEFYNAIVLGGTNIEKEIMQDLKNNIKIFIRLIEYLMEYLFDTTNKNQNSFLDFQANIAVINIYDPENKEKQTENLKEIIKKLKTESHIGTSDADKKLIRNMEEKYEKEKKHGITMYHDNYRSYIINFQDPAYLTQDDIYNVQLMTSAMMTDTIIMLNHMILFLKSMKKENKQMITEDKNFQELLALIIHHESNYFFNEVYEKKIEIKMKMNIDVLKTFIKETLATHKILETLKVDKTYCLNYGSHINSILTSISEFSRETKNDIDAIGINNFDKNTYKTLNLNQLYIVNIALVARKHRLKNIIKILNSHGIFEDIYFARLNNMFIEKTADDDLDQSEQKIISDVIEKIKNNPKKETDSMRKLCKQLEDKMKYLINILHTKCLKDVSENRLIHMKKNINTECPQYDTRGYTELLDKQMEDLLIDE